jgi:hypothetical protein
MRGSRQAGISGNIPHNMAKILRKVFGCDSAEPVADRIQYPLSSILELAPGSFGLKLRKYQT